LTSLDARVVVVDDAPDALDMLLELIAANGYEVRGARDGAQALRVVSEFGPHCVLFDVQMPGLDGPALAAALRAAHGNDLVLIAVSGCSPDDEKVAATFDAVDYWLTKPIDIGLLQQVLPPLSRVERAPVN
jgi:DNA-binding response OmpR family regulator